MLDITYIIYVRHPTRIYMIIFTIKFNHLYSYVKEKHTESREVFLLTAQLKFCNR